MTLDRLSHASAKHLRNEIDRVIYLAVCLEQAPEDREFIRHAMGVVKRSRHMRPVKRRDKLKFEPMAKAIEEMGDLPFASVWNATHAMGYQIGLESNPPPA